MPLWPPQSEAVALSQVLKDCERETAIDWIEIHYPLPLPRWYLASLQVGVKLLSRIQTPGINSFLEIVSRLDLEEFPSVFLAIPQLLGLDELRFSLYCGFCLAFFSDSQPGVKSTSLFLSFCCINWRLASSLAFDDCRFLKCYVFGKPVLTSIHSSWFLGFNYWLGVVSLSYSEAV